MGNTVVASVLSMAGLGLLFASLLAIVNQKLRVEEDPKVQKIENALPGLNCASCGYTSCHHYAELLAKGEAQPDMCKAGGDETISSLSEILGVKVQKKLKEIAILHCGADGSVRKKKAIYVGLKTCIAAHNMSGGENLCAYGCLGFGDCMRVCPFGAITMLNGLPGINGNKCTACGKCVEACPRGMITVEKITARNMLYVSCNNPERGPETRKTCNVGCIACGICQKLSAGVFAVNENLARVQYEKMSEIANSEEVIKKCPTKCIAKL